MKCCAKCKTPGYGCANPSCRCHTEYRRARRREYTIANIRHLAQIARDLGKVHA